MPHRELLRRPQWLRSHAVPPPLRHTPHTFRGPIGSSTEGPMAAVRMRPAHPFRHTPHTFRGPIGSSTEGTSGKVRMRSPPHFCTPNEPRGHPCFRTPSHILWPHKERHRRPPSPAKPSPDQPIPEEGRTQHYSHLNMVGFFARLIFSYCPFQEGKKCLEMVLWTGPHAQN